MSTSAIACTNQLTIDDICKAAAKLKTIECPFARYMRQEGFDPDEGCIMILPKNDDFQAATLPSYVKMSCHAGEHVHFIRDPYVSIYKP